MSGGDPVILHQVETMAMVSDKSCVGVYKAKLTEKPRLGMGKGGQGTLDLYMFV